MKTRSHKQRKDERREIARKIKDNLENEEFTTITALAEKMGLNIPRVQLIGSEFGIEFPTSRLARVEKYENIAEACKEKPVKQVAEEMNVSQSVVYIACKKHGVKTVSRKGRDITEKTKQIIQAINDGEKSQVEIAREFGVSRQRINQVKDKYC